MRYLSVIVAAAAFAAAGTVYGQESTKPAKPDKAPSARQPGADSEAKKLAVGDKAPPLSIETWVKGDPVTGFEKGKIYVVEFWATWCGPCVASMPHLSELQKEYKDQVTIIGVTTEDPNNSLEQVKQMVETKGDGMGYTVAWDQGKETKNAYMKAAGRNGIPCSFVVDREGKLAYIGHPMFLDIPLDGLVKGTWDSAKGGEKIAAIQKQMSEIAMTAQTDPKAALKALEQFEREQPKAAAMMSSLKYKLLVDTDDPRAAEMSRKMVDEAIKSKDAMKLNEIAWGIVDPEAKAEKRDLDLAFRAAKAAVEITKEKDGMILDTLAWAYFHKGEAAKAVEIEKKALGLVPESPTKDQMEESLKTFEEKSRKD